jgi:hypothetical protein
VVYLPETVLAAAGRQRHNLLLLLLLRAGKGSECALPWRLQVLLLLLLVRLIKAPLLLLVLHRGRSCNRTTSCK